MRAPTSILFCALLAAVVLGACTTDAGPEPPSTGDPNPNGKPPGEDCASGDDCRTGVCAGAICQVATNTDGVRNGDESDVDCGGSSGPACGPGRACVDDRGCASGVCADHRCGGEACGAGDLPRCADGAACAAGADCQSGVCDGAKTCAAPTFDDGVKNGAETDVDCGGPGAPRRCAAGEACLDHADCASDGCAFDKTCALGASCTRLEGGQTCGPNDVATKQADCCERAKVGPYTIDKYLVTAGRMRAFLERHGGKVRDWAATLPAGRWDQAWTAALPNQLGGAPGDGVDANTQLGPYYGKRSCATDDYNGHTFWTPAGYDAPGDPGQDFPQEVLDTKALNCVPWWLMAALCAFDGGHLATAAELRAAYTNDGTTAYPWGARGGYTTGAPNDYAVQVWGYSTPNPPAGARRANNGDYLDVTFHIAPPGRRPMGYNATGHADLVGDLLEWVGDEERRFVWNGSFENHGLEIDQFIEAPVNGDPYSELDTRKNPAKPWRWQEIVAPATDPENVNGYYGIGGRCAY